MIDTIKNFPWWNVLWVAFILVIVVGGIIILSLLIKSRFWLLFQRVTPAGHTPPVAITSTSWNLGKVAGFLLKAVLILLLIAAVVALGGYIYTLFTGLSYRPTVTLPDWLSSDEPYADWVTWVLAVVMIVALVVAFMVGDWKKLLTYAFVTVLLLFVLAQYKFGGLYIGYRRDILYLLGVVAIILVAVYATAGKERFTFGVLVAAVFILLGFSHIWSWDVFKSNMASWRSSSSSRQVAATSSLCDGNPTTYSYDNPYAKYSLGDVSCQKRAYVKEGCVWWLDSSGNRLARTCNGPMPSIDGINYLKPESTAIVITNRCRAFATGNLVEKCA